mmetsp:Transcript_133220/g.235804  ORF Transcript_133220/g.235804 Transcript_133220/m.235804 type:complete len:782 (+) Transcript_133220:84-2429(+)
MPCCGFLTFLAKDEQLRVQSMTDLVVYNGPCTKVLIPGTYRSAKLVKAETLGLTEYVKLRDTMDGSERVEKGPKLLFLGAYDTVVTKGTGMSLSSTEYVTVTDNSSGQTSIKIGPCVFVPGPTEAAVKGSGISLNNTEYALVEDRQSGEKRVEKGPKVWFPASAYEKAAKGIALSLSSTEYVLIVDWQSGERRIERGPCTWFPTAWESGEKGAGLSLSSTEFVLIEDKLTGEKRVQKGPCVWFPGPQEQGERGSGISLSPTEYIFVEDKLTGEQKMTKGPCVWFPNPYDKSSAVMRAIPLQDDEYIKLKDTGSGKRWVQKGKALIFLEPTWKVEGATAKDPGVKKAFVLKAYEYIRLIDSVTGKVRSIRGENTVFPEPDEDILDGDKLRALDLKVNEYVKILDQSSGEIRVVSGSNQVFLGPHETVLDGGKRKAIEVDDEHAVLVRDKSTGQTRLVVEKQLFVPGAHESIEEVRSLIRLADHEAMILKDTDGLFHFYYGSDKKRASNQPRAFFLPPSHEIVKLNWSRGRRREKRDLYIERFDCRAQYMSFEFNTRTKDNVELVLEGTFFWEVVDLPLMVKTTGDTSGDICNHARSQFIKHVAKVTLKEFMDDLSSISVKVYEEDNDFYLSRGVQVHSLEVTSYQCAEASTSEVLQQIIQETTNRMNRLSQAESENEVKLFRMQGQIEQEKLNGELLQIQHEHSKMEALVAGQAEAERIKAFINGLHKDVPQLQDRMSMWETLRKTDALSVISEGGANLYYTPSDVNLSIENRSQKQVNGHA